MQSYTENYLCANQASWSASPGYFDVNVSSGFYWARKLLGNGGADTAGLRPMVSLKSGTEYTSGSGLATDPYIVP